MQKNPCLPDCKNRSWDCHQKCPVYLAAYRENLERYEKKENERRLNDVRNAAIKKRVKARNRKQNQI